MSVGISENDLPSVKFENELKKFTNYYEFEDYRKGFTSEDSIDIWIDNFKKNAEQYLTDSYNNSSFNNEKRCKDFNSLITNTKSKLGSLSNDIAKTAQRRQNIREWRKSYFSANLEFMCIEEKKYGSHDIKTLDNFCEDSEFIKKNMNKIKKKEECESIYYNIFNRKNKLLNIHNKEMRGGRSLETDNNFHNAADTLQMRYESAYPNERSSNDGALSSAAESGKNNIIALVSLPVFGILVSSFLFYRYTPFGSMFHEYFRNNEDISINENDEVTCQMLSGTSKYNDIYSENMQYNLSYQTFQN
ncbi:PIR Superfamily Protein [Plasmodium ovale curtisi]|uniref:PIR Superfamily Protein n=1 Tax=Plasmodium ovale curtisi TaxID=864141 RepID=A0A1A8X9T0_PLAOA|nr:PIR Superfamily Protein [Plasmodium ovale curtisi]SBT02010.1 PIR Superfamily Protein [Plasmodium ovale curtisi]